jgi:hypothetical protein
MKFNLSKEIRLLREEVFQQLPHSRQEKRRLLLEARSLLWNISTEQVYKEKKRKELLSMYKEALFLVFASYQEEDFTI